MISGWLFHDLAAGGRAFVTTCRPGSPDRPGDPGRPYQKPARRRVTGCVTVTMLPGCSFQAGAGPDRTALPRRHGLMPMLADAVIGVDTHTEPTP